MALSCLTTGPGWFGDLFEVDIKWATDLFQPGRFVPKDPEEEEDPDAPMPASPPLIPVFVGRTPIRGEIQLTGPPRTGVWQGGVRLQLECGIVRFQDMETFRVVRHSIDVAPPGTVTGKAVFPFLVETFLPADLPESFEGDTMAVRCHATVVVERPWWTFDVIRTLGFATQDVRPDLGERWRAIEDEERKRVHDLLQTRIAGSAPKEEEAEATPSDALGPVYGLTVDEAEAVPWWLVVSDCGANAVVDLTSCVVATDAMLDAQVMFQHVTRPVVRVRVRVLRVESLAVDSHETVLFDGDAMNALKPEGIRLAHEEERKKLEAIRKASGAEFSDDVDYIPDPLVDNLPTEDGFEGPEAEEDAVASKEGEHSEKLAAAASIRGAGTLWAPARAILVDSSLKFSLDFSKLDVFPTSSGEAEDPDGEPPEPDGEEAAAAAEEGTKRDSAATQEYSVRTLLQVWVYSVKVDGDDVADPSVPAGTIIPSWNTRELLLYRESAVAVETDERAGAAVSGSDVVPRLAAAGKVGVIAHSVETDDDEDDDGAGVGVSAAAAASSASAHEIEMVPASEGKTPREHV
jgi:hypothetical protein